MTHLHRRHCLLAAAALVFGKVHAAEKWPDIAWEELVPPGWDPTASFGDELQKLALLPDTDARVQAMYERMRKIWDEAPTVKALEGRKARIPGFIVPLEQGPKGISEFLLVPYFGACIHTPPPPANQIIHVHSKKPVQGFETMDAVWVSGTMGIARARSDMGQSGYRMQAEKVQEYVEQ